MPKAAKSKLPGRRKSSYVATHRRKLRGLGLRRVEVAVKSKDFPLIRAIAGLLREDGSKANDLRNKLKNLAGGKPKTGAELLALLRQGPLFEDDFILSRDKSISDPVRFE